jgi:hypothetical protein
MAPRPWLPCVNELPWVNELPCVTERAGDCLLSVKLTTQREFTE